MAIDSGFWIEFAKVTPSIVTATTAVVGVVIALRSLDRWHREAVGKRRVELAEDVLAEFYEARDIIQAARSPLAYGGEGSTRKRFDDETEDQARSRDAFYAIAERLQAKSEFFAKFNSQRYRFRTYFGETSLKPYEEVRGVYNEIIVAVRMLITTSRRGEDRVDPKLTEKWEKIIWWGLPEEDAIAKRLDDAIVEIEKVCRPIIQDASSGLR
jgi:hypothetical protein